MGSEIVVSIICNTYNQEKYIAQTLDSFLMQKTDFAFEILVHDDASTDRTTEIVRQYAEKYPGIVKPYIQTENHYSKGWAFVRPYQYGRAQGEFVAWCEGDDYWTDPNKLQLQVEALRKHPEADICTHQSIAVCNGKESKPYPAIKEECVLSVEQVIEGGGAFVSTNSLMARRALINGENDYTVLYNLDFVLQISGALRGGMVYLPKVMAAYRKFAEGSWTNRVRKDRAKQRAHRERLWDVLRKIDEGTGYVHTKALQKCIWSSQMVDMARHGELRKIFSRENKQARKSLPIGKRLKVIALATKNAICR